jgi:hypothetical protein
VVAAAVFSLTNVNRPPTNSADHIAIIDTATDQVVKFVPTQAGTHGVNWGAKRGGGYTPTLQISTRMCFRLSIPTLTETAMQTMQPPSAQSARERKQWRRRY